MTVQILSPETIRLCDLISELGLDEMRVDNWIQRDQLPVSTEPRIRGRSTRIRRESAERLAIFLVVASLVGPTRAISAIEDGESSSGHLTICVGCATILIDLPRIRMAVLRAENYEIERRKAA